MNLSTLSKLGLSAIILIYSSSKNIHNSQYWNDSKMLTNAT